MTDEQYEIIRAKYIAFIDEVADATPSDLGMQQSITLNITARLKESFFWFEHYKKQLDQESKQ